MTASRPLLFQVKRMLALDAVPPNDGEAASTIGERTNEFANALFEEAVASDDVTSAAAAIAYLDDRLVSFQAMLSAESAKLVRVEFARLVDSWR